MRSGVTLLLDRDGTLVHNVPYNNDVTKLRLVEGVIEGLAGVRARGVRVGLVSNQSGVARGLTREKDVAEFNSALAEAVGGFDLILCCTHLEGCDCRKPAPGMLLRALHALDADPDHAVMVGDIGSDVQAAKAAGIKSILVPQPETKAEEIETAPVVRRTFVDAMAAVCAFCDTGRLL